LKTSCQSTPLPQPPLHIPPHPKAVPADVLKAASLVVVADAPGKRAADRRHRWLELPLGDVFKLDVSWMAGVEDYVSTLSRKGRWNFKDRQRK
jgi:hypothetical protein